jgi:hypothetical protein
MKIKERSPRSAGAAAFAALLILLIGACTTTPYSQREENVQKIVELIQKGESAALIAQSQLPFLFDGEIVMLERDLRTLWTNLAEAGFSLQNPQIEYLGPAGRYSYSPFADSMEVRTFFKKYLPEKSSIVRITAENGVFFLLLGPKVEKAPAIIGYRMNL